MGRLDNLDRVLQFIQKFGFYRIYTLVFLGNYTYPFARSYFSFFLSWSIEEGSMTLTFSTLGDKQSNGREVGSLALAL